MRGRAATVTVVAVDGVFFSARVGNRDADANAEEEVVDDAPGDSDRKLKLVGFTAGEEVEVEGLAMRSSLEMGCSK